MALLQTLMCAGEQKQWLVTASTRSRRLRDLVLAGVHVNSLSSHDANADPPSVAESLESLLHAGYRYFELGVREHRGLLYWSTTACNAMIVHEEISAALVTVASFTQQSPSEMFVLRFTLESRLLVSSGYRLLRTLSTRLGSRSVPASNVFQSTVHEMLSTRRNVVLLIYNLSSFLPFSSANVSSRQLPDIFVEDNSVWNSTAVNEWNVVDQGGLVLEHHRSVDTLSVITLYWQPPEASTISRLLLDVCDSSLLPMFTVCVVVIWAASRLTLRCSVYRVYTGVAVASVMLTFLLTHRMRTSDVSIWRPVDVNNSCASFVDAARYWVVRPARYHLNVLVVDNRNYCCHCACPCACPALARLAALANAGLTRRQVTLHHAGGPLSDAVGLRAIFACPPVLFAYVVTSRDEGHVVAWSQLSAGDSVNFDEGEFPMDATVTIYVATVWNRWLHVSGVFRLRVC